MSTTADGLVDLIDTTANRGHSPVSLTLPSGGVFSLLNRDEIAEKIRREKERTEIPQKEIMAACKVATKLVASITDIEHFFVAGNPEFVETAKNDPESDVMKAYSSVVAFLQKHLQEGSVEETEGNFSFGGPKPHCVIPSRIAVLHELVKLTNARQENGDELRALTLAEITKIAANLNALVKLGCADGPHLRVDQQFFGVGTNKEMTEKYSEQFQKIVGKLISANKALVNKIQRQQSLTLHEQANIQTIEQALEKGGIYLATIPESFNATTNRTYLGGQVLFCFDAKRETVSIDTANQGQPFANGPRSFLTTTEKIREASAEISFDDVRRLIKEDHERPNGKRDLQNFQLWCLLRNHANWLRDYRREKANIAKMKKDGDLTIQEFLDGQTGNIVLVLEKLSITENKVSKTIYPAAIRVSRSIINSDKALQIIEASPNMMPFVSCFIGEGKVFPENNLTGVLAKFVTQWKKERGSN